MKFTPIFFLLLLGPQDPPIDRLMDDWSHSTIGERDQASAAILARWREWKDADLLKLEKVLKSTDPEVATRARDALDRIRLRRQLGDYVLAAVKDVESRLLGYDEEAWLDLLFYDVRTAWNAGELDDDDVDRVTAWLGQKTWKSRADDLLNRAEAWYGYSFQPISTVVSLLAHEDPKIRARAAALVGTGGRKELAHPLAPLLKDESPAVRAQAAESIGLLGAQELLPELASLLEDKVDLVWSRAIVAMGRMRAEKYFPRIVEGLRSQNADRRVAALRALWRFGAKDQSDLIIQRLGDEYAPARIEAITALCELHTPTRAEVIAPLLHDREYTVRVRALEAFQSMDPRPYSKDLLAVTRDEDYRVRMKLAPVLTELPIDESFPGLEKLLHDEFVDVLAAALEATRLTQDKRLAARVFALFRASETQDKALATLTAVAGPDEFNGLVKLLESDKRGTVIAAMAVLADIGNPCVIPQIVPGLKSMDPSVRGAALRALSRLDAQESVAEIVPLLRDPDRSVQSAAIKALGDLENHEGLDALAKLLGDSDARLRQEAADAFCMVKSKRHRDALAKLLGDPKPEIRWAALYSLSSIGDRNSIKAAAEFLNASERQMRECALSTLGKLGAAEYSPQIAEFLKGHNRWLRSHAIEAIGLIGTPRELNRIAVLASRSDNSDRGTAVRALAFSRQLKYLPDLIKALRDPKCAGGYLTLHDWGPDFPLESLRPLLESTEASSRTMGVELLAESANPAALHLVIPFLEDLDPWMRARAALALAELAQRHGSKKEREEVASRLRISEKDWSVRVRRAAGWSLIRLGAKSAAEVADLLESVRRGPGRGPLPFQWNEILISTYEPERWQKLNRRIELKEPIETADELAALFADRGFTLDKEELPGFGRWEAGATITLWSVLNRIDRTQAWMCILDGDQIRFVRLFQAMDFWRKKFRDR